LLLQLILSAKNSRTASYFWVFRTPNWNLYYES